MRMTPQEMIREEIDNYSRLQRIKDANGEQKNKQLDYEITVSAAKLQSYGVNLEKLTL